MIIDTARRLWNSPTFTTWGSYATQSFNFIFVLPLLLTRFSTAEIAVWYLFKTVLDLQFVVDLGISVTFSRFIAYLMGTNERRDETLKKQIQLPNFENDDISLSQIWGTMNLAYLALSLSSAFIISIVITIMLRRPISFVENQNMVWSSWGIVVFTFFISLNGMKYSSFLQGINAIAEYRRYETLTNSGSILTSFIVLLSNGNILSLVLSQQAWKVINVLINRRLTKILRSDDAISIDSLNFNREIFSALWPASWRSGLGQFMSYGVTQISGLVYAQFGSADNDSNLFTRSSFNTTGFDILKSSILQQAPNDFPFLFRK